jgi:hypothetical protein
VLIPETVVALASIALVLAAVFQHGGAAADEQFDPSEMLQIVAAAAAGDLVNGSGTEYVDVTKLKGTDVKLRPRRRGVPTLGRTRPPPSSLPSAPSPSSLPYSRLPAPRPVLVRDTLGVGMHALSGSMRV